MKLPFPSQTVHRGNKQMKIKTDIRKAEESRRVMSCGLLCYAVWWTQR